MRLIGKCFVEGTSTEGTLEELSESFSFALVNGALGVFEVQGKRIRDFRCVLCKCYLYYNCSQWLYCDDLIILYIFPDQNGLHLHLFHLMA